MSEMDFVLRFVAIWSEYPLRSQRLAALLYLSFECFSRVFVSVLKEQLASFKLPVGNTTHTNNQSGQSTQRQSIPAHRFMKGEIAVANLRTIPLKPEKKKPKKGA